MKNLLQSLKIIFIPICWATEFFWQVRYGENISGHEYREQKDGSLLCDICGKVSK